MHRRCAARACNADIWNVLETMRHAVQGFARGETWMAMSAERVDHVGAATTPNAQPEPTKLARVAVPTQLDSPTDIDLTTELPNVMLAADMVSANIAVLQRAASAYQAIMAMGTEAQRRPAPDEIDPADSASGIA
ncbi:MAG TPA: hypothetical protein VGO03_02340 [Acidimicrobiia bacterium]|jgi:hypothetical protein